MVDKILIVTAWLGLAFVVSWCGGKREEKTGDAAPALGPAPAVPSKRYTGQGMVEGLNPNAPSIEINHGDIDGFMPAMQMEFPVTDPKLLNGLAINDRIDFTVENDPEGVKVVAIKKIEAPSPQKAQK